MLSQSSTRSCFLLCRACDRRQMKNDPAFPLPSRLPTLPDLYSDAERKQLMMALAHIEARLTGVTMPRGVGRMDTQRVGGCTSQPRRCLPN